MYMNLLGLCSLFLCSLLALWAAAGACPHLKKEEAQRRGPPQLPGAGAGVGPPQYG